jgi:SAM-dependent methyltransferase
MSFYGTDLARIHDAGFGELARAAAAELLARAEPPGLVIDLGCGSGITAEALLEAGFEVLGIDVSEEMLALARARAPGARFVRGSAQEVPLEPAVAIAAVGEVLGYPGTDLRALLRRAHTALAPGGVLLFDLAGPGRGSPRPERTWSDGDGWVVCVETVEDPAAGTLTREITTFREHGSTWRRSDEVHRLSLHPPAEVLRALEAAGFAAQALDRYGELRLPPGLTAFAAVRSGP